MQVHYGESTNWMIIHDLRLEHAGSVAQIDHLIINRFMDMWVCESKNFSEGIAINEHGEFLSFYGSKPSAIASPIEQNAKHQLILKRLFDAGTVKLPTRLGFTMKPAIKSLVLVSKRARISRPATHFDGLECIIKNDQLFNTINKSMESTNALAMTRVVGKETLEGLAREIAKLHKPIVFNWLAKFGLSAPVQLQSSPIPLARPAATVEAASVQPAKQAVASPALVDSDADKPNQKLDCHTCAQAVPLKVARFCWFNKPKFGGNAYCIDCQKIAVLA